MKVKEQLKYKTGSQKVQCEDCESAMNVRVSGVKKNRRRGSYREYHGTCRHCGVMYSGAIRGTRF